MRPNLLSNFADEGALTPNTDSAATLLLRVREYATRTAAQRKTEMSQTLPVPLTSTALLSTPTIDTRNAKYQTIKGKIHHDLLNRLNLDRLTQISRREAEPEIRTLIDNMLDREAQLTPLTILERESLVNDVMNELFGLGPLEALLKDPTISDILVNRATQVYIEREGRLEETEIVFRDDRHLMQIIERIVSAVGRRVDESSPMVDARLADGSRVNVIIPPLALDGPSMSIRRFRTDKLGAADLVTRQSLTQPMLDFLRAAVGARLNVIVSGGTGAGKTTMLNVLSSFISPRERMVTIEDAAELMLRQPHVVRLETRPPNIEGKGGVRQRQLVINALRMRPDRIIVGEVRGEEALDMLQAMNTGHDGSLTTIHANSPRDSLYRLDTMVAMANLNVPDKAVRQQIASAINVIVQVNRMSDGTRKVTSVSELTGMEGETITMQEIFAFQQAGIDPDGKVIGRFRATGIRPKCADKLATAGNPLPMDMFEHDEPVNQAAGRRTW
jgi:pilus assembly protein CpaF